MNTRVEIPAYTDRWMMGDRCGEIVGAFILEEGEHEGAEVLRVKLDKSGKLVRVLANDCRFL